MDYPDYGIKLALKMTDHPECAGILVCGTGVGMSMVVNRFPRIRGALCHDLYTAQMSRAHNDANVLILGAGYREGIGRRNSKYLAYHRV